VLTAPGEVGMTVSTTDVPGMPAQGGSVSGPLQGMVVRLPHHLLLVLGSTDLKVTANTGGSVDLGGKYLFNPNGVISPFVGVGGTPTGQTKWTADLSGAGLMIVVAYNWKIGDVNVYAGVVPAEHAGTSVETEVSHVLHGDLGYTAPATGTALTASGLIRMDAKPEGGRTIRPDFKFEFKFADGQLPGLPDIRFYAKTDGQRLRSAIQRFLGSGRRHRTSRAHPR